MLDIIFGRENVPRELVPITVLNSVVFFRQNKKPEWFSDPFIQEFLKSIDGSDVLFEEALRDYRGHGISTEMMSTGCKTLCCIYYFPDKIFHGSLLGDNCLPFLIRIAETHDITILLEHYADFTPKDIQKGIIRCNNQIVNQDAYDDAFSDWNATTQEADYIDRCLASGL